ncbi:MAG: hypothetical protein U1C48_10750 [Methylotenera sp.]|nr:hypothetical protein [Methylotenera sp.]
MKQEKPYVLAMNVGSSSIKFTLYRMGDSLKRRLHGKVDCLPQTGNKGIYLKQQFKDKLIEHKQYIDKNGQIQLEIRNWKWSNPK